MTKNKPPAGGRGKKKAEVTLVRSSAAEYLNGNAAYTTPRSSRAPTIDSATMNTLISRRRQAREVLVESNGD